MAFDFHQFRNLMENNFVAAQEMWSTLINATLEDEPYKYGYLYDALCDGNIQGTLQLLLLFGGIELKEAVVVEYLKTGIGALAAAAITEEAECTEYLRDALCDSNINSTLQEMLANGQTDTVKLVVDTGLHGLAQAAIKDPGQKKYIKSVIEKGRNNYFSATVEKLAKDGICELSNAVLVASPVRVNAWDYYAKDDSFCQFGCTALPKELAENQQTYPLNTELLKQIANNGIDLTQLQENGEQSAYGIEYHRAMRTGIMYLAVFKENAADITVKKRLDQQQPIADITLGEEIITCGHGLVDKKTGAQLTHAQIAQIGAKVELAKLEMAA